MMSVNSSLKPSVIYERLEESHFAHLILIKAMYAFTVKCSE